MQLKFMKDVEDKITILCENVKFKKKSHFL